MNIIISHVHVQDNYLLAQLEKELSCICGSEWNNLSISDAKAIRMPVNKEEEREQEIEVLQKRIRNIASQIEKHKERVIQLAEGMLDDESMRELRNEISVAQRTLQEEVIKIKGSEYCNEKLINNCKHKHEKTINELESKLQLANTKRQDKRLTSIVEEEELAVRRLRHEQASATKRADDLLKGIRFAHNYSASIRKVDNLGLMSNSTTIGIAIYDSISLCDAFIVIGAMYNQYRPWLEYEFKAAQGLGKPIIGIIPLGQDVPKELSAQCDEILMWNNDDSDSFRNKFKESLTKAYSGRAKGARR